jgi:hypothetical protein
MIPLNPTYKTADRQPNVTTFGHDNPREAQESTPIPTIPQNPFFGFWGMVSRQ